ncbi:MAG: DUF3467 domain-containing protein [Chloroflexota bacterium]
MNRKKPVQVQIDLPADLEPTYSNLAMISHSQSEFFVDLACMMPNLPKAKVHTRAIMTPTNAKLLLNALAENVRKYEAQFGEIPLTKPDNNSPGNTRLTREGFLG